MENQGKIIVILGPTSSGKTDLSIKLAKKLDGEIISADSRQVYKGMNIGTGKVTKKEMAGIPHYLLDVANPKTRFSVAQYQKLALRAIKNIQNLPAQAGKNSPPTNFESQNKFGSKKISNSKLVGGKIPFLVGGTGFYIQSVADGIVIPEVKPDWRLRKKLEKLTTEQMFKKLKELDPKRAKSIDKHNPRRLIRALEIVLKSKRPVGSLSHSERFKTLFLGIKKDQKELNGLIKKRLLKRLDEGMINEVKRLHKSGISFKRLEEFGLEYRYVAQYLQGKLNYNEMVTKLEKEIEHYAKRQMTWFKRDKRIHWINPHTKKKLNEVVKLCKNFLIE